MSKARYDLVLPVIFLAFSCIESQSASLNIAVHQDINFQAESLFISKEIIGKTVNKEGSDETLVDYVFDRLRQTGVKIVPAGEDTPSLTVVQTPINTGAFRLSPNKFPVNRSVDIVFCHNPTVFDNNKSFKCNHITFEFQSPVCVLKCDFRKLNHFIWTVISSSEKGEPNGTSSTRPVWYKTLEIPENI